VSRCLANELPLLFLFRLLGDVYRSVALRMVIFRQVINYDHAVLSSVSMSIIRGV
jgi:hypothetical protein